MFETLDLTRMANALASHAGQRLGLIARNVANADTPGYRASDLPEFAETYQTGSAMRATRPGHVADDAGEAPVMPRPTRGAVSPNGNSVSVEAEMVKAVEVRQDHDMALAIYRSTADILRASLGRNR